MPETHYLEDELNALIQSDPTIWQFIREASLDGVWYWDLENPEHEYMSPEFWQAFGFDPAERKHLASEWMDLIHPDDLELAKANLDAHLADENHPYDQVVRYKRADGKTAWVRCRGMAVRDETGKPVRLLGAHNDITALKSGESAATRTSAFLTRIMETSPSGILGLSAEGQVTAINSAGRHFLRGVSAAVPFDWPDEINFLEAETLSPMEASQNPVLRCLAGAVISGEVFLITGRTDAEPRYVRVTSQPGQGEDKDLQCVIVMDDVTDQEKSRQQMERSQRLDALGQLTGGIAHDFNNLLATVQYALQLAKQTPDTPKRETYLDAALTAIDRGNDLTKRLLAFGKLQPGVAKSYEVHQLLKEIQSLAAPIIESNINLSFQLNDLDLWVFCDGGQFSNAVLNLLINARDAILQNGGKGAITISARSVSELDADVVLRREHADTFIAKGLYAEHQAEKDRGDNAAFRYVEISVTDDGPGMAEEVKRRAIDPFFSTKEMGIGTGLGLSMVYGFVRQSGGELRIYSEPGVGTTVRLLLPRGTDGGLRENPVARQSLAQGSGERILVVEDEGSLRMMLDDMITSMGYEIVLASSGDAALKLVEAGEHFDLMITDIVMPGGLGGFDLARKVRALKPAMPIVYMSGYTGYSESDMYGVVAPMIRKPCPPGDLADAISSALQGDN